jgi:hypothetical protein
MANPINTSWALLAVVRVVVLAVVRVVVLVVVLAVALVVVLAVVLVVVLAAVLGVLPVLYFVSYTRCDLILCLNVKPPCRFD